MDLTAYVQIEDLGKVAKANGIDVPRLRGYRWMGNETLTTEEAFEKEVKTVLSHDWRSLERVATDLLEAAINNDYSAWRAAMSWKGCHEESICTFKERFREQVDVYNKYVGRKDVLMIHSRMGSSRIREYNEETGEWETVYDLKAQPWFLDYVRDAWDSTYCDIYAKLDVLPDEIPNEEEEE